MESVKILKIYLPLILLGVVSRVIPHPANFTVMGGLAVWLGSKKNAPEVLIPILSMFVADLFLGFDSLFMRLVVYGSVGLMYLIGRMANKNLWLASITGSWVFFIVTNSGVFLTSTMYPKTLLGLTQCFYMALPFWRNALLADVIFTQVFHIAEKWLKNSAQVAIIDR